MLNKTALKRIEKPLYSILIWLYQHIMFLLTILPNIEVLLLRKVVSILYIMASYVEYMISVNNFSEKNVDFYSRIIEGYTRFV